MDDYDGKKVLITGGLGFIGSNLAIRLVESGASVTIVDCLDPTGGGNFFNIEPVKHDVEVIQADSADLRLMRRVVAGKSWIFSLAGRVSHIDSMRDPFSDLRMNCVAPLTVLEACKQANRDGRIIYSGTRQAYGRPDCLPLVETHPLRPVDVNGVNKMAGEWYHMVYGRAYGMWTASLRLVNTYGPRQLMRHSRQGFAGWFIRKAIEGGEIQLFGDGQQLRGFNYVDDVVDAMLTAGITQRARGDYFNLGGIQPFTLETFAKLLIDVTGRGSYRLVPFPEEKKNIDVGSVYSSWAKFNLATGWAPRVSLEEGVRRTVDYYEQYKAHYW